MNKKNKGTQVSAWLEPEVYKDLIAFQGILQFDQKQRMNQSKVINEAIKLYIEQAYKDAKESK